jgi:hypothetical protein
VPRVPGPVNTAPSSHMQRSAYSFYLN